MHYYKVIPNTIFNSKNSVLTYCCNAELSIGQVVVISIGKKRAIAIVVEKTTKPDFDTREIHGVVEKAILDSKLISLAYWMSDYYLAPLNSIIQTILPSGIEKSRKKPLNKIRYPIRERTNFLLNTDQINAINTIFNSTEKTSILHGVTGSGKTAVYIELAKKYFSLGKSTILLVPEISLTPQLIAEFSNHFENLVVYHSKMTEADRHLSWIHVSNSKDPLIIIGPRSAIFMPAKDIGIVIIDEAHDQSYRQDNNPKYSTLTVASVLADKHGSKLVIGSATPNVTDLYIAEILNKQILKLPNPAILETRPPKIELIDLKDKRLFRRHKFFSDTLLENISNNLSESKQTLIFHNRRGSSSYTACYSCGWSAECPNCKLPLTLHIDKHSLRCHICNYARRVDISCPNCKSTEILHKGIGTKLIESELNKLFSQSRIARFDTDNSKEGSLSNLYQELYNGNIDIAIGTQIISKGLDLPNLKTVGIIQADTGFNIPDFTTNERMFQTLTQVMGRVGRNNQETNIIIQTYNKDDNIIKFSLEKDYESFYRYTIDERASGNFPPFVYMARIVCRYKTESSCIKNIKSISIKIKDAFNKKIAISGPSPCFYERSDGYYRWQIVLKSKNRSTLLSALKLTPSDANWQTDIDPPSLL